MTVVDASAREHGDREAFLDRIRSRQARPTAAGPHPVPPSLEGRVPEVRHRNLDGIDPRDPAALVPAFVAAAGAAGATVHQVDRPMADIVTEVVTAHHVRRAVHSTEDEVGPVLDLLRAGDVDVVPYSVEAALEADLGVTSAVAAVAATGSVVVDADRAGSRGAGLVPAVHICVVPVARLVATPSDVLRRASRPLPSNRVLVTGPSRTGDIEQILTMGVHGPVAVHLVLR